jgi:hypothetical protein
MWVYSYIPHQQIDKLVSPAGSGEDQQEEEYEAA